MTSDRVRPLIDSLNGEPVAEVSLIEDPVAAAAKTFGPRSRVVVEALGRMMSTEGAGDPAQTKAIKQQAYQAAIQTSRDSQSWLQDSLGSALYAACADDDPTAAMANAFAVAAGRIAHSPLPPEVLSGICAALATYATAMAMTTPVPIVISDDDDAA